MQQHDRCNATLHDALLLLPPFFPNPEVLGTDHLGANLTLEFPMMLVCGICHRVSVPSLPRPASPHRRKSTADRIPSDQAQRYPHIATVKLRNLGIFCFISLISFNNST